LFDLAKAKSETLCPESLDVVFAGNIKGEDTWLALYDGSPVASCSKSGAGEDLADIFNSPAFSKAVKASAKENGVETGLSDLGFKSISVSLGVDEYVQSEIQSQVEAQIAEARTQYETQVGDYAGRFEAAIATASAGINNGFFKGVQNPIKSSLTQTISSLGIQGADRMVAQAFASGNSTYLKNLVAKTKEIMRYDTDVQNQLTEAIAGVSSDIPAVASAGAGANLSIGTAVELPVTSKSPKEEEATASSKKVALNMDSVLSTLSIRRK
jgi:hypothetical protein